MQLLVSNGLKAGFNNILIKPERYHWVEFVTNGGLFRFQCMIWGLANAPMWVQMVVDHVIMAPGVDATHTFIDKITIGGTCECW